MEIMDMHIQAGILFCVIITLSYTWVKYKSNNAWITSKEKREVYKLFNAVWDGTEEDKWYAWLKVRKRIKTNHDAIKKVCYIHKKLVNMQNKGKIKKGNLYVSENSIPFLKEIESATYQKLHTNPKDDSN